jgi:hypothetical protein
VAKKPDKHQAFMHYCEAWKSSPRVAALSLEAYKGFFEILNSIWLSECELESDEKTLIGASRLTPRQWRKAKPELFNGRNPLLTVVDGHVVSERLYLEWDRTKNLRSKQSEAAKEANRIRWEAENERKRIGSESDKNRTLDRIQTETETETETVKEVSVAKATSPPKASPSWGNLFDSWWLIWPRKTAKGDALKAYRQVVVDGKAQGLNGGHGKFAERHERLMAVTPLWTDREFASRESTTIPYPATFLRRLDWLEAPPEAGAAPRKRTIFDEVAERRAAREVSSAH